MKTLFTETDFAVSRILTAARLELVSNTRTLKGAKAAIVALFDVAPVRGGIVHWAHVRGLFAGALSCTRKADFIAALDGVDLDNKTQHADYAIKIVAQDIDTGEVLEFVRADVAHLPNAGDIIPAHDLMASKYLEAVRVIEVVSAADDVPAAPMTIKADNLELFGAALAVSQAEYTKAQIASIDALNAAVDADPMGTGETPEFEAYNRTEEALQDKAIALALACGRYSIELAQRMGRPASDIASLKAMFRAPADMHPGRLNELVAHALKIDVNAIKAR